MGAIKKILPKLLIILAILPLVGINLVMAYIIFAPNEWWKPFYLEYSSAQAAAPGGEEASTEEPAGHGEPAGELGVLTPEPHGAPLQIPPGHGLMIDTGAKIVNLGDPSGRKLLRAGIVLEFAPADLKFFSMEGEEKELFIEGFTTELNEKLPVVNDILITLLSSKTFDMIYTAEGKEVLRQDIINTINTQLPEYRVIFVYFTEFVVQ
jgi:flagellar FliL protein